MQIELDNCALCYGTNKVFNHYSYSSEVIETVSPFKAKSSAFNACLCNKSLCVAKSIGPTTDFVTPLYSP